MAGAEAATTAADFSVVALAAAPGAEEISADAAAMAVETADAVETAAAIAGDRLNRRMVPWSLL